MCVQAALWKNYPCPCKGSGEIKLDKNCVFQFDYLSLRCFFSLFILDSHPPKYRGHDGGNSNNSPENNCRKTGTILSEDYAEIVDEEGDYSTPAGGWCIKN